MWQSRRSLYRAGRPVLVPHGPIILSALPVWHGSGRGTQRFTAPAAPPLASLPVSPTPVLDGGVTALVLTYNEEANLGRVLDRLVWVDRVLVLDSFSTDRTLEIARAYPNVDIHQRAFDSFAGQCNHGLGLVETEWTLSLDADYVLTPELVDEIAALPDDPDMAGYEAGFTYVVGGHPLRGTLYPPRTVLYRTAQATYRQDGHAHRVEIDGPVGALGGKVWHDDRKPLASWLDAQRRYAAQEAAKLRSTPSSELGRTDRLRLNGVWAPVLAPLYALLVKGGLLDGRAGWHYALQRAYAEVLLALHLHEPPEAARSTSLSRTPPRDVPSSP